jgi:hypothetical protein
MADWLDIIEPMEQTLAGMLARAEPPPDAPAVEPPLDGAVPLLDEVLAPAADRLAEAERHAQTADALLEDAVLVLTSYRKRLAALRDRLASYDKGNDRPAAQTAG